jgi:sugar phosphate isomerase/epimerase
MLKLATKFAPHEAAMILARDAGYRHAEIWTDAAVLADWRAVAERCVRYPFGYVVHFPNREPRDEQSLADAVSLYRALDCPAMVIHQPLYDQFGARLLELDGGLRLAVENHELSPAEFEAWAEHYPGLTLDVEHLWKYTLADGPLERLLDAVRSFLDQYGHQLLHVHMPGYQPGQAAHRPMHASPEMVSAVFTLLSEYDYQGLVVSELAGTYQTAEVLAADMALFHRWARSR